MPVFKTRIRNMENAPLGSTEHIQLPVKLGCNILQSVSRKNYNLFRIVICCLIVVDFISSSQRLFDVTSEIQLLLFKMSGFPY